MAPAAWVRRLVTLCDQAPATPFDVVQVVVEEELGRSVDELFERFDTDPIGSASIAQVTEVSDLFICLMTRIMVMSILENNPRTINIYPGCALGAI